MKQNHYPLYLLFFFLYSALPSKAQELSNVRWIAKDTTATRLQVIAYWNKGDAKKYRARKLTYKYMGDSLISETTEYDAIVQFRVVDSTEKSYEVEFRMLENKRNTLNDPSLALNDLNFSEKDLTLYYTTDEMGMFKEYKNQASIEKGLDQLMKKIVDADLKNRSFKTEAERNVAESLAGKMANGKVLFSNIYGIYISQFHNLHGYATGLNDTLNYTESTPGLMGDKLIDLDCYLYITSIDTTSYEVRYDTEKYADLNEFMKGYAGALKETAKKSGVKTFDEVQANLGKLDMKMEAYITNYIDLESGWPTFLKVDRILTTKDPATGQVSTKEEIWSLDNSLEDK
jgi:hypothetical protein